MFKKIALRASLAVTAVGVAIAFLPSGASVLNLGPTNLVATYGPLEIAFNPAVNPAFKMTGEATECTPGTMGHLWVATTVTATHVPNATTAEVRVQMGARTFYLQRENDFSAQIPTTQQFNCSYVVDNQIEWTAVGYRNSAGGMVPQPTPDAYDSGQYGVMQID